MERFILKYNLHKMGKSINIFTIQYVYPIIILDLTLLQPCEHCILGGKMQWVGTSVADPVSHCFESGSGFENSDPDPTYVDITI